MWITFPHLCAASRAHQVFFPSHLSADKQGVTIYMDKEKLWKTVLVEIELLVAKPVFQTQFSQSKLVSLEKNVATIGFPNPLIKNLVELRQYSLIKSIIDRHLNTTTSLVFV